jgi:hypothetical protein
MARIVKSAAKHTAAIFSPRKFTLDGYEHPLNANAHRWVYNTSEYMTQMVLTGYLGTLIRVGDFSFIPVLRPCEWSMSGRRTLPIPPILAANSSIYLGIISELENPSLDLRDGLFEFTKHHFLRSGFSFVQPALSSNGILRWTGEFIEVLRSLDLDMSTTCTRIIDFDTSRLDNSKENDVLSMDELLQTDSELAISNSYLGKRRYDIRRAIRLGLTSESRRIQSDIEAVNFFSQIMELHQESWTRTGLGFHSLKYWTNLSNSVRNSGGSEIVTTVKDSVGELCSVVVVHCLGESAFYQMNSTSSTGLKLSASPLCLHSAIISSAIFGYRYFELGRMSESDTAKQRSVYDFKAEFGGSEYPVANFRTPARSVSKFL